MITELLTGNLLHLLDMLVDLTHDLRIDLTTVLVVLCAGLCRDGETLWNRETDIGHLCKVCALTTQKLTHVCVTLREQVNPFLSHRLSS